MVKNEQMDMQVNSITFLNDYKAQLFDLVNEEFEGDGSNLNHCLSNWVKAVQKALHAKTVLYYRRMDNSYQLTEGISLNDHPVTVFPDTLDSIFEDGGEDFVIGTDSSRTCISLF